MVNRKIIMGRAVKMAGVAHILKNIQLAATGPTTVAAHYSRSPAPIALFAIRFTATLLLVTTSTFAGKSLRRNFWSQLQAKEKILADNNLELSRQTAKLEKAQHEVKTLSGLLPICSCCKRVRDDKGYWRDIENYIHAHADAQLSASICVSCLKEQFPEVYNEMLHDGEIRESAGSEDPWSR